MLFLVFHVGADPFALDVAAVVEVLPLLEITAVPQAPMGIAGVFQLRGAAVPAVDLGELLTGRRVSRRLSTRIVVVRCPQRGGGERPLGLMAERVTGVLRRDAADFAPTGIANPGADYLGSVTHADGRLVQRVDVERLLPPALHDVLFC